jgi:hypothetical protein
MSRDPSSEDFVLSIVDVFSITGRGTAVIGPFESGAIRTGDSRSDPQARSWSAIHRPQAWRCRQEPIAQGPDCTQIRDGRLHDLSPARTRNAVMPPCAFT